jgi:hypothetical protein
MTAATFLDRGQRQWPVVLGPSAAARCDKPGYFRHAVRHLDLDFGDFLVGLHVDAGIRYIVATISDRLDGPSGGRSADVQSRHPRSQLYLEGPIFVDGSGPIPGPNTMPPSGTGEGMTRSADGLSDCAAAESVKTTRPEPFDGSVATNRTPVRSLSPTVMSAAANSAVDSTGPWFCTCNVYSPGVRPLIVKDPSARIRFGVTANGPPNMPKRESAMTMPVMGRP